MTAKAAPNPTPVTESTLDAALREVWPGLGAYVGSLLGAHRHLADDVLQETALFVWEKRAELPGVRNFNAWVFRAAYFKTLAVRRDLSRSKELMMDDEIFERLAIAAEESASDTDARLDALASCIEATRESDRRLIEWRYRDKRPLTELALLLNQTRDTLHQRVCRLRRALRHCVEHKLAQPSPA